jgi:hypothetical protein
MVSLNSAGEYDSVNIPKEDIISDSLLLDSLIGQT